MPFDFSKTNPELAAAMKRHEGDAPALLGDEIQLCRALLDIAAQNNQPGLCATLLAVLSRLSTGHVSNAIRANELLEMSTVQTIARKMSQQLVSRLGNCPGYEGVVDALCADFADIIDAARHGRITIDAESNTIEEEAIENTSHPAGSLARSQ
jgi:hypothetical protein